MNWRRGDCSPAFRKVHAGLPDPNRELQLPSGFCRILRASLIGGRSCLRSHLDLVVLRLSVVNNRNSEY